MFGLFGKKQTGTQDVKEIRQQVLSFIKQLLSRSEGGEGSNIRVIHLFIIDKPEERQVLESAVYLQDSSVMQGEIQRMADDFDLGLPADWNLEIHFVDELPSEALRMHAPEGGVFIQTRKKTLQQSATAYITILGGEAEQPQYQISAPQGKINIGREKNVQVDGGFFRLNHIAFPATSGNDSNRYISRQHAHIAFDTESACFMLYADEGGIPPRNKTKIKSVDNPDIIKLHSPGIGYRLQEGDQIVLGESAVILFSYQKDLNL